MIRKILKKRKGKNRGDNRILKAIEKYNIPQEYFSINRRSVSRGVGIGLFWGFIPMPFQMAGVVATTPLIRFNVPIAIAMVWLSNPFTMPAMYYMEYLTGNFILQREKIDSVELSMNWFANHWSDIVLPLYVGTTFYSLVISFIVYILINWCWKTSVLRERKKRKRLKDKRSGNKN
jgi:uncharacterized protein (DUF2062 family)